MPAEPSRLRRPAPPAGPHHAVRRGWLSHTVAALAVSVLGLGLAGSITPTTSAQPLPTAPAGAPAAGRPVPSASPSAVVDPAVTAPFEGSDQQPEPLRKVLVAERAAQRAEELAKTAEAAHREARRAGGQARQQKLTEAQKATEARAAQLAKEALERAAAARAAAVAARLAAEAAATQQAAAGTATSPADPAPAPAPVQPAQPAPPVAPPPAPSSGGGFAPVPNAVVGAGFGEYGLWSRYHTGLDFRAAYGVPIRSAKAGLVLYAGNSGDWAGNHVAVQHGDGMTSMSSHMSRMTVTAGQTVQAGQIIGYVGQTGRAFGAHLHYELYPAGVRYGDVYRAVNPVPWLRAAGVTTR